MIYQKELYRALTTGSHIFFITEVPSYAVSGSGTQWFWVSFPKGVTESSATLDSKPEDFPPHGIASSESAAIAAAIDSLYQFFELVLREVIKSFDNLRNHTKLPCVLESSKASQQRKVMGQVLRQQRLKRNKNTNQ